MLKNLSVILSILLLIGCSQFDKKLDIIKQNHETLEYILHPKHFVNKKAFGRYTLSEVFADNDENLNRLKKTELLNGETTIFYSSPQCISLVIRTKKKFAGGYIDYVIFNNLNESDFACGINSIYNLNQDDEVRQFKIKVKEAISWLTLAIVEGD